jgi:group I intron endonuclease
VKSYGVIYRAVSLLDGRCYVGQTIRSFGVRRQAHLDEARLGLGFAFARALRKQGPESFVWEVLRECQTREELDHEEAHYIDLCSSFVDDHGYNLTRGGDKGLAGHTHSAETKSKMRLSSLGRSVSTAARAKIATTQKTHHTAEFLKRMSDRTKTQMTPEFRKRLSDRKKELWQQKRAA